MEDDRIPAKPTGADFEVTAAMAENRGHSQLDAPPSGKSARQLIRRLSGIAGKGGNVLLNVALDGQGAVPEAARKRLDVIGGWLQRHGESIYGTSACSLAQPDWGCFTQRGNTLYAHVFDWPAGELVLPVDASLIQRIELLGTDPPVSPSYTAAPGAAVRVNLPATAPDPDDSVLRVRLKPE